MRPCYIPGPLVFYVAISKAFEGVPWYPTEVASVPVHEGMPLVCLRAPFINRKTHTSACICSLYLLFIDSRMLTGFQTSQCFCKFWRVFISSRAMCLLAHSWIKRFMYACRLDFHVPVPATLSCTPVSHGIGAAQGGAARGMVTERL